MATVAEDSRLCRKKIWNAYFDKLEKPVEEEGINALIESGKRWISHVSVTTVVSIQGIQSSKENNG